MGIVIHCMETPVGPRFRLMSTNNDCYINEEPWTKEELEQALLERAVTHAVEGHCRDMMTGRNFADATRVTQWAPEMLENLPKVEQQGPSFYERMVGATIEVNVEPLADGTIRVATIITPLPPEPTKK